MASLLFGGSMRYFRKKSKEQEKPLFGITYYNPHPLYNACTLYFAGENGLAVIQQRFDPVTKRSWWSDIDRELVDDIYRNEGFEAFFMHYAKPKDNSGNFPTVTIRQIMWALRMKPLPKQRWETVFDHKPV